MANFVLLIRLNPLQGDKLHTGDRVSLVQKRSSNVNININIYLRNVDNGRVK